MELASMLAGEQFGDHPRCVCPVIAGFLRSYNDRVDAGCRLDLYAYASRVVGTRADVTTERRRAELCRRWAGEYFDPPPLRVQILCRLFRWQGLDVHGIYAARAATATKACDDAHSRALELLEELIACGGDDLAPDPTGAWAASRPSSLAVR
jgi:hypothetical protein